MHKCDGPRGRGGPLGAVVETSISREIDEGHVRRYLGGGKEAAATGIWQASALD